MSVERLEDALYEAALKVTENPRHTTAAIFYLKNRAPGRWRDVKDVRQTDSFMEMIEQMPPAKLLRMVEINVLPIEGYKPEDSDLPVVQPDHQMTYQPPGDPEDNFSGTTRARTIQLRSTNP